MLLRSILHEHWTSEQWKELQKETPVLLKVRLQEWRRPGPGRLVASLARPGGNLTGVSFIADKRLELLSELVPRAGMIALLMNPNNATAERVIRDVQEAARTKGLQLQSCRSPAVSTCSCPVS